MELDGYGEFELIGSGGNAHVYRAMAAAGGGEVAVKVLHGGGDKDVARRFERERTLMSELASIANVVPVYESGFLASGDPYLVMALYEGGSLQDRVESGPMPWREAVEITKTLADSIALAHAKRILHLDVKPANVLLDAEGQPWLGDFGIAEAMGPATLMSAQMFTPAYTAPERLAGGAPQELTDTYAVLATLFALLAGRQPFVTDTMTNVVAIAAAVQNDPLPVAWLGDDVPDSVKNLLLRGMDKVPARRPRSAIELVGLIEDVLAGRTVDGLEIDLSESQQAQTIMGDDLDAVGVHPVERQAKSNVLKVLAPVGVLLIAGVLAAVFVLNNTGGDDVQLTQVEVTELADTDPPDTEIDTEVAGEIETAEVDFDCMLDLSTFDDIEVFELRYGALEGFGCDPIVLGLLHRQSDVPWVETVRYCVVSREKPTIDIWLQAETEAGTGWIELDHEPDGFSIFASYGRELYALHEEPNRESPSTEITFADADSRITAMRVLGTTPDTGLFVGGCRSDEPNENDEPAFFVLDWVPRE